MKRKLNQPLFDMHESDFFSILFILHEVDNAFKDFGICIPAEENIFARKKSLKHTLG